VHIDSAEAELQLAVRPAPRDVFPKGGNIQLNKSFGSTIRSNPFYKSLAILYIFINDRSMLAISAIRWDLLSSEFLVRPTGGVAFPKSAIQS
jgi:hypothetical protein